MKVGRLLARSATRRVRWTLTLAVVALLSAAAETLLPAALGRTTDAVLGGDRSERWFLLLGGVVAANVLAGAVGGLSTDMTRIHSRTWLQHSLLGHLLALGPRATRTFRSGDLVTRLVSNTNDAGTAASTLIWGITDFIPAIGGLVGLTLIDPWLTVTFLVGAPLLFWLLRTFARDSAAVMAAYLEAQGAIAARLVDALAGARTIAAARTVDRETKRILEPLADLRRQGWASWRVQGRAALQTGMLSPLLEIAILAVAGYELSQGRVSVGGLLAAIGYAELATGLSGSMSFLRDLADLKTSARRIATVLDEPAVEYGDGSLPAGPGQLEYRNVTVEPVLREVDLVVPGGAFAAVVGVSGVGKSLLASLPGRLSDPDDGEVLLDGVPVSRLDAGELRRAVTYGFDRPVLLGDTVGEAIAFGPDDSSTYFVAEAAGAAAADGFIRRLPEGYFTPLAQAPMSGGETQRIGLARAYAHPGRLMILDDATSSLDTVTEMHVGRALTEKFHGRTRLVVTHRISTAARADLVAWLDGGRIRAVGPHAELWKDPAYRAVFELPDEPAHPDEPRADSDVAA